MICTDLEIVVVIGLNDDDVTDAGAENETATENLSSDGHLVQPLEPTEVPTKGSRPVPKGQQVVLVRVLIVPHGEMVVDLNRVIVSGELAGPRHETSLPRSSMIYTEKRSIVFVVRVTLGLQLCFPAPAPIVDGHVLQHLFDVGSAALPRRFLTGTALNLDAHQPS